MGVTKMCGPISTAKLIALNYGSIVINKKSVSVLASKAAAKT